ncbi:MAG: dihydrolipoyl dehydrogenase [Eubacteriales bacterium]|nr:dihydrolipoyl dehydrogenase [Eubacteriales bacterium]
MQETYDLIIIGAGPAGYTAAEAAAKRGMKTAVIENRSLGGTCLNRGCIPTKTILHSADLFREIKSCSSFGIHTDEPVFCMEKVQEHKQEVIAQLASGITSLLKKNKVTVYEGTGTILDNHTIRIRKVLTEALSANSSAPGAGTDPAGDFLIAAKNILICTGSAPAMPPIPGIDLPGVVTSDTLLEKQTVYKRLLIIGGGVIGMEFASIYQALGSEVIVVEALDRLLANMDKELSQSLKMLLKKRGAQIHTGAKVQEIRRSESNALLCTILEKDTLLTLEADGILVAAGRRPCTEQLFEGASPAETGCGDFHADHAVPRMERGYLCVNEHFETSIPHIYAAGDVIGGIQLAHAASAEALHAVCHMAGETPAEDLSVIPSCVYTSPEIASVGITPDEAKRQGLHVRTVKYPMSANGKSVLSAQERGFVKVTADAESQKILGAQMMCARATDMISAFSQAISLGLTWEQMASVVYPHPTFSEGIKEAVALF